MNDRVTHLVVPGLLGPPPRKGGAGAGDGAAARRFPLLERWLTRADRTPVPADAEALLFRLFGLLPPERADLPTGPVCYLADSGQPPEGVVFHADPVHLRPDQDRLLLFDAPAADLTRDEADAFVTAFNDHFRDDGWRLSAPTPGRWYLHVARMPALRTHPLGEVIGRNVDLFLPEGKDARRWRQALNEAQMLFHHLAANAAREAAGRLPVSGLWLHGGGALPGTPRRPPLADRAATPLLTGLRSLADSPDTPNVVWLESARRALWDADAQAWYTALAAVEARLARVAGAGITCLYPGDGHGYRYRPSHRWRLWRRSRPLAPKG